MRLKQWKRLEAARSRLSYQHRQVVIIEPRLVESDGSVNQVIERWKAGEVVEGIMDTYQGGEVGTICVLGAKHNDT